MSNLSLIPTGWESGPGENPRSAQANMLTVKWGDRTMIAEIDSLDLSCADFSERYLYPILSNLKLAKWTPSNR